MSKIEKKVRFCDEITCNELLESMRSYPEIMIAKLEIVPAKYVSNEFHPILLCTKADGIKFREELKGDINKECYEFIIPDIHDCLYRFVQIYNFPLEQIIRVEMVIDDKVFEKKGSTRIYFSELQFTPFEMLSQKMKIRIYFKSSWEKYIRAELSGIMLQPEYYDFYRDAVVGDSHFHIKK